MTTECLGHSRCASDIADNRKGIAVGGVCLQPSCKDRRLTTVFCQHVGNVLLDDFGVFGMHQLALNNQSYRGGIDAPSLMKVYPGCSPQAV